MRNFKFNLENLGIFVENVSLGAENLGSFEKKFNSRTKNLAFCIKFSRLNSKISSIFAQKTHFVRSGLPRLDFVKSRNDAATPNLPKFQHFFKTMLIFSKKMPKFNLKPKISSIFTKKFDTSTKIKDFIAQKFSPRTQNLAFIIKIHAPNAYNKGIL